MVLPTKKFSIDISNEISALKSSEMAITKKIEDEKKKLSILQQQFDNKRFYKSKQFQIDCEVRLIDREILIYTLEKRVLTLQSAINFFDNALILNL
ncbi:MAG: hypothetical protein [Bacteriophage sp.]|nr:MAG: hypothetical protein [Bacteriophage sp.]